MGLYSSYQREIGLNCELNLSLNNGKSSHNSFPRDIMKVWFFDSTTLDKIIDDG